MGVRQGRKRGDMARAMRLNRLSVRRRRIAIPMKLGETRLTHFTITVRRAIRDWWQRCKHRREGRRSVVFLEMAFMTLVHVALGYIAICIIGVVHRGRPSDQIQWS